MHVFGKINEFEIKYQTLREKYKDDPNFHEDLSKLEYWGEMKFIIKNKNLFGIDYAIDKSITTYNGSLFAIVNFFCKNLYFHIIDDPFPTKTIAQNAIDMMDEMKLVEGEDNDLSKYADVDFDKIDMALYTRIDQWNWRHGFVGNAEVEPLPHIYMRKSNNMIEFSWDSSTPYKAKEGHFYFMHGKGVDYIDLQLYKDTVVAFCLDFFERLQQHYPQFIDEFKIELQKAIDVKL